MTNWFFLPFLLVVALCNVCIIYSRNQHGLRTSTSADLNKSTTHTDGSSPIDSNNSLSYAIVPGTLPGYTGWARPPPEHTLAGKFEITSASSTTIYAGQGWHIDVQCSSIECASRESLFYLRAYGPSVITGLVDDHGNGAYTMEFYPIDPGAYTVEVVLTFSSPPSFELFPLGATDGTEPGYEGYLLPHFPLQIKVLTEKKPSPPLLPFCDVVDIAGSTNDDAAVILQRGRWKVKGDTGRTLSSDQITLEGYQAGLNSLGITMEYTPFNCAFMNPTHLQQCHQRKDSKNDNTDVHVIFIGDSVMGLEYRAFNDFLQEASEINLSGDISITTSVIGAHGGLAKKLDTIINELDEIQMHRPDEKRVILFNSGLHDIAQLCSVKYKNARAEYLELKDEDFSCVEMYKSLLGDLVRYLSDYPADLLAFRTTSAGWMPYGNFGFAWKPTEFQRFSLSPNFVEHMNDAAMDVIRSINENVFILDGYYLTSARPDHREANEENAIGKHLVHPGPQVVRAMAQTWLTAVLRTLCDSDDDWPPVGMSQ